MTKFCKSLNVYSRRLTNPVGIADVTVGGENAIAVQSMTNTDTNDTQQSVAQILRIREAGGHIIRLTAQGEREAENLGQIMQELKANGATDIGIVADIHFMARAALKAAQYVDKVRINPGNYKDPECDFRELIALSRKRAVALRIGVNHGSLSEAMVEKYGDTTEGMVASAMQFLRICQAENFDQVVVSMKSSNVRVMVQAYRMLVVAMDAEDMHFPLHLGVTEAGDGADARIKSAAGVGALLTDGLGDTLRVSLTEAPENEIPVGEQIVSYFAQRQNEDEIPCIENEALYSPFEYKRRETKAVGRLGAGNIPLIFSELNSEEQKAITAGEILEINATGANPSAQWRAEILNLMAQGDQRPVIIKREYTDNNLEAIQIQAAADMGIIFLDGLADGIHISAPNLKQEDIDSLSLSILQATRVRMSKTEYIACPGCGRTLYDLQTTLQQIKKRTNHLKGLKIGVMGCIVNGPGEMADADYGYVGSGRDKITLYKGKQVVRRNLPSDEALDALIELIRSCGDWHEVDETLN